MAAKKHKKPLPKKRGPKPNVLVIKGDWEGAVSKALRKAPPSPVKRAGRKA